MRRRCNTVRQRYSSDQRPTMRSCALPIATSTPYLARCVRASAALAAVIAINQPGCAPATSSRISRASNSFTKRSLYQAGSKCPVRVASRRLLGKAAFKLGDTEQAQSAYRAAIAANDSAPAAWMGLAELADATGASELAAEAHERLVR